MGDREVLAYIARLEAERDELVEGLRGAVSSLKAKMLAQHRDEETIYRALKPYLALIAKHTEAVSDD